MVMQAQVQPVARRSGGRPAPQQNPHRHSSNGSRPSPENRSTCRVALISTTRRCGCAGSRSRTWQGRGSRAGALQLLGLASGRAEEPGIQGGMTWHSTSCAVGSTGACTQTARPPALSPGSAKSRQSGRARESRPQPAGARGGVPATTHASHSQMTSGGCAGQPLPLRACASCTHNQPCCPSGGCSARAAGARGVQYGTTPRSTAAARGARH